MPSTLAKGLCCLALSFLVPARPVRGSDAHWVEVRSAHFIVKSDASAKEAQDVAVAFENIREVFHQGFPNLKVDPPNQLVILALRDEASMKALLPWYWESGGVRPSGVYYQRPIQDFAVVQADLWSRFDQENHAIYHEFTHSVFRLNFRHLPTWLNEGLADYYGDTVFGRGEVSIGKMNRWRLRFLDESQWIPMDTLLKVDERSPYYNEGVRASLFYAQSWLLARYLLQDPEAVRQQTLQKYIQVWLATGDGDRAARETLGDLTVLQNQMHLYLQRKVHGYQRMKPVAIDPEKDMATHPLSPAEGLVALGAFLLDVGHSNEAAPYFEQARTLAPQLSSVHTGLGTLALKKQDREAAEKEFLEAMKLDPSDFLPAFRLGQMMMKRPDKTPAAALHAVEYLETAVRLNPAFAPAYDALAQACMAMPEKRARAAAAEKRAFELNSNELDYLANLGRIFLAQGQLPSAKAVGEMLKKLSFTARDKEGLASYLAQVDAKEHPTAAPGV